MIPQVVITTHSSHILDAVEFRKARYFQRCLHIGNAANNTTTLNASKVLSLREHHQKDFLFYERVLAQQPKDKNKIYSLHEPAVYCIGKGKDHKQYEYGNKVSIASTAKTNIIVGVVSHESNSHDNHTLPDVLSHIESSRGKEAKHAVCDRGYRGKKTFGNTEVILPSPPLNLEKSVGSRILAQAIDSTALQENARLSKRVKLRFF